MQYTVLTRTNYVAWAIKMKVFMQAHEVWDVIEPKNPQNPVGIKKDKMAMVVIYEAILLSIAEKQTANKVCKTLQIMDMGADQVRTSKAKSLKDEFEVRSMKESESVDDFSTKISAIVSNIKALGDTMNEAYMVKKILRVVPSKFVQIVSTIEQFTDLDTMSVEEVVGRLKAYEERIRGHVEHEK